MSGIANLDYGAVQDILSGIAEHPKVKRGPKPGSKKDQKTLLKQSVSTTEPKKRGRGRPAGSKNKNKKTLPKESVSITEPKKRGRPAGSKNSHPSKTKKNIAAATVIQRAWVVHVIC